MTNASLSALRTLKLTGMATAYEGILGLPHDRHPEGHELIARLVEAEAQERQRRRMVSYLRLSKLRYAVTLHDVTPSPTRNLSKQQLALLADLSWIERGENVLITGATGCGKSFLACALGNHACAAGQRTLYYNLNRFTEQIALAQVDGTIIKWLDRIRKARLLILDDFGLQSLSHPVKMLLLQVLEDRYERAATIIASQLPVSKWHEYINEPTVADAILDRLVNRSHRVQLTGDSLRTKPETVS